MCSWCLAWVAKSIRGSRGCCPVEVMNQLLIPLLGLTGIPALLEFLEVKLKDEKEDGMSALPLWRLGYLGLLGKEQLVRGEG